MDYTEAAEVCQVATTAEPPQWHQYNGHMGGDSGWSSIPATNLGHFKNFLCMYVY